MKNILNKYANKKEFVCVYSNKNRLSVFDYAKVLAANDDYTVLYQIAPNGKYDGVSLEETEAIIRVEQNDVYDEKMRRLMFGELFPEAIESWNLDDLCRSFLTVAQNKKTIIQASLLGSDNTDIMGFVTQIEGDICEIALVDEYGYPDGNTFIRLVDFSWIACESEDCLVIQKLWESRL